VALFFAMLRASAWALPEANWTAHLQIVGAVGGWGVISGALVGRSRFGRPLSALIWLAYGVFLIGAYLAATLKSALTWHERSISLLERIAQFLTDLVSGHSNNDALMFVFVLAVLYWSMGYAGAWALRRRSDLWWACLPCGVALVTNLSSYGGKEKLGNILAVYALFSVLLAVRLEATRRQANWRALNSTASPDAANPILLTGALAAIALVLLAWGGPAYARSDSAARAWTSLTRPWNDVRDRLDQVFRSVRNPSGRSTDLFGASLSLAAGEQPATGLVLRMTPSSLPAGGRFYWRSHVYGAYEDGAWGEAQADSVNFDPQAGNLPLPAYRARRAVEVVVAPLAGSLRTLFGPAQPTWTDRSGQAELLSISGEAVDITALLADVDVVKGETYRVRASIAIPTGDELRRAGMNYPAWVTERYLQLPDSLTPRTLELAREITAGATRPYDQAMAITRWLRRTITYQRVTKPPPRGVEPIDWFLFTYRTGFCNWDASAEVILLRSLGIPARLAAGYAQGNLIPTGDTLTLQEESAGYFEVQAEDSHVWPEVFFPGYGWVEFEPTPSQPELIRPESGLAPGEALPGSNSVLREPLRERLGETVWTPLTPLGAPIVDSSIGRRAFLAALLIAAVLLLLGGALWLRADPLAWTLAVGGVTTGLRRLGLRPAPIGQAVELRGLTPTGRIYVRWCLWLKRLGLGTMTSHTPYERAEAFSKVLPSLGGDGWLIAQAYTAERFGNLPADVHGVRTAWKRIHRRLWRLWVTGAPKP
jgi:transglutaminase-like putative cysteine protease